MADEITLEQDIDEVLGRQRGAIEIWLEDGLDPSVDPEDDEDTEDEDDQDEDEA